jgi:hypothetical protein
MNPDSTMVAILIQEFPRVEHFEDFSRFFRVPHYPAQPDNKMARSPSAGDPLGKQIRIAKLFRSDLIFREADLCCAGH